VNKPNRPVGSHKLRFGTEQFSALHSVDLRHEMQSSIRLCDEQQRFSENNLECALIHEMRRLSSDRPSAMTGTRKSFLSTRVFGISMTKIQYVAAVSL